MESNNSRSTSSSRAKFSLALLKSYVNIIAMSSAVTFQYITVRNEVSILP